MNPGHYAHAHREGGGHGHEPLVKKVPMPASVGWNPFQGIPYPNPLGMRAGSCPPAQGNGITERFPFGCPDRRSEGLGPFP
jgi:hypothetical protein